MIWDAEMKGKMHEVIRKIDRVIVVKRILEDTVLNGREENLVEEKE